MLLISLLTVSKKLNSFIESDMELEILITQCEDKLYLGYTNVESSGLPWLNVRFNFIYFCKRKI